MVGYWQCRVRVVNAALNCLTIGSDSPSDGQVCAGQRSTDFLSAVRSWQTRFQSGIATSYRNAKSKAFLDQGTWPVVGDWIYVSNPTRFAALGQVPRRRLHCFTAGSY